MLIWFAWTSWTHSVGWLLRAADTWFFSPVCTEWICFYCLFPVHLGSSWEDEWGIKGMCPACWEKAHLINCGSSVFVSILILKEWGKHHLSQDHWARIRATVTCMSSTKPCFGMGTKWPVGVSEVPFIKNMSLYYGAAWCWMTLAYHPQSRTPEAPNYEYQCLIKKPQQLSACIFLYSKLDFLLMTSQGATWNIQSKGSY